MFYYENRFYLKNINRFIVEPSPTRRAMKPEKREAFNDVFSNAEISDHP
jgi:hypothetical protein